MKPRNSAPGIYYYKNKINGKLYIGQAQNLHKRRIEIRYDGYAGAVFNNAIKKYGIDNFEYGILTHCKVEKLNYFEMFYIKRLKTKVPNGYNMTDGGDGVRGLKWDEEKKEKYKVMMLGEGNPNFGNKWDDGQRKRASEYMKERIKREGLICVHTPKIIEKCNNTRAINKYGKTLEEINEIVKNYYEKNNNISYSEISKKYGISDKMIKLSEKKLELKNDRSIKLKEAFKHNPYIVQCDRLNHNIVLNIFPSLKEAVEKTGIKSIHHCTHGFQENAGGYFWRFNNDGELPSEIYNEKYLKPTGNSRKLTDKQKKQLKEKGIWKHEKLMKKVYCFNLKGELIDICQSTKEAGKKYNVDPTEIVVICKKGKQKSAKGMTFSYTDIPVTGPFYKSIIYQYTIDGELVNTFDSIKDACKATGAKDSSISSCIAGKYKTSVGFVWKRETKEIM